MKKLAIPMDDKAAARWRERVVSGAKLIERHIELWRQQQAAYLGVPLKEDPTSDVVIINKDMPRVKQKVAQLFVWLMGGPPSQRGLSGVRSRFLIGGRRQ